MMLDMPKGRCCFAYVEFHHYSFQSHVSLCWASMILSHSIWLDKGVVDSFLGAQQKKPGGLSERPLTQGGVSLQQAEFPLEVGNSGIVAPLHHFGISDECNIQ